jgi:bilin biosynthesis protein
MAKVQSSNELEMRLVELRDPDWNVRHVASRALVDIGESAVESLALLLEEDDNYLRGAAAKCLGEIGGAGGIGPLIDLFDDENGAVRQEAVRALGHIGVDAVKLLLDRIKDPSTTVQRCVVQALKEIRDPGVSPALQTLANDMDIPAALRWEAKIAVNRLREQPQR